MKASKWVVVCVLVFLVGAILGLLLGDRRRDRISKFNIVLLEAMATNTLVSPVYNPTDSSFSELLAIWRAMEALDRRLDSETKRESIVWRLEEGLLARKYATERLAPVVAGILQSRGLSLVDYFRLEDELRRHVAAEAYADPRTALFRSLMEERSPVIHGLVGNLGIRTTASVSQQDWMTFREPISQFLGSNYSRLSDIDGELLLWLLHLSSQGKHRDERR